MTISGALAMTGMVLLVLVALPCSFAHGETSQRTGRYWARAGVGAFAAGAACLIASVWVEALG